MESSEDHAMRLGEELGEERETIYKPARRMPCIIEEHTGVFMGVYAVLLPLEENAILAELRIEP